LALAEQELPTLLEHLSLTSVLDGVGFAQAFVFFVGFCGQWFVFLSFFIWTLYCLSFFESRLLVTSLVSSNISPVKYPGKK
jgi:hypothetical protein